MKEMEGERWRKYQGYQCFSENNYGEGDHINGIFDAEAD